MPQKILSLSQKDALIQPELHQRYFSMAEVSALESGCLANLAKEIPDLQIRKRLIGPAVYCYYIAVLKPNLPDILTKLAHYSQGTPPFQYCILGEYPSDFELTIFPKDAGKGTALQAFSKKINIPIDQILKFGDTPAPFYNDADLLVDAASYNVGNQIAKHSTVVQSTQAKGPLGVLEILNSKSSPIRAIATDFDGTLTQENGEINPEIEKKLKHLLENGTKIALVTMGGNPRIADWIQRAGISPTALQNLSIYILNASCEIKPQTLCKIPELLNGSHVIQVAPVPLGDRIKDLRHHSKYLQIRRTRMAFQGFVKDKIYVIASEEMPILFLPLIRQALQTKSSLFFIERGGYPMRMAVKLALQKLGLENKIKLYSYKTTTGRLEHLSANEDLARTAYGFIESTFPRQISAKLTPKEIDMHIRPLFDQLSPQIQQKFTQSILKKYPKYSNLFEFIKDRPKAEVLREFIEADPAYNVLDDILETNIANQADNPESVFCRAQHGQTIPITWDCFGKNPPRTDSEKRFREYVYQKLKPMFPDGVNINNLRKYHSTVRKLQKEYLMSKLPSFQFATIDLLRYLANSYGLNQGPMIFSDDGVGAGTYYFKSMLFYKIFGTGEFHFNVTEDCGHNTPGNKLPLSYLSNALNFPEDEPEMFPFYYKKIIDQGKPCLKRIEYQSIAKKLSRKESKIYTEFLKKMDDLITDNPLLEKILKDPIVFKRYSFQNNPKGQLAFKRALLFYFLEPQDNLIGLMIEYFGYVILHEQLDYLYPQYRDLAKSLKEDYLKIRNIHQKQIVLDMMRANRYFKKKLYYFSDFFSQNRQKIKNYLNTPFQPKKMNNTMELTDPDFIRLLEDFYRYIDDKKVIFRGQ